VYVIGHYDIPTNSNIVLPSFAAENAERFVHFRSRQKVQTFLCIECDEVKRSSSVKQSAEPWWPPRPLFFKLGQHDSTVYNCERRNQFDSLPRCSHGALSPCSHVGWASTERGGYNKDPRTPAFCEIPGFSVVTKSWQNIPRQLSGSALGKPAPGGDWGFQIRDLQIAYGFHAPNFTASTTQ
jgi:hypothetical protein